MLRPSSRLVRGFWAAPARHLASEVITPQVREIRRAALRERINKTGLTLNDFMKAPEEHAAAAAAAAAACGTPQFDQRPAVQQRQPFTPNVEQIRKPKWLKATIPEGQNYKRIRDDLRGLGLNTVCEEAKCPNIGECWGGRKGTATATIMLLGDTCTRACKFCAIKTSKTPAAADPAEPERVAQAVAKWGIDYVVMTSVDRDDMPDGGAQHFANTIRLLKQKNPKITIEALVSDFAGMKSSVETVALSGLDVYAHNIETVESLQRYVRDHRAGYRQSLSVLQHAKKTNPRLVTKSGMMLGCGEQEHEVTQAMKDLLSVGVEILTIGQYLRPTKRHLKVHSFITPERFEAYRQEGERLGFRYVAAGPLVRSSYRAGEFFVQSMLGKERSAIDALVESKK